MPKRFPNKTNRNSVKINEKYGLPESPVFSIRRFSTNSKIISEIACNFPGTVSAALTPNPKIIKGTIDAKTIKREALVKEISNPKNGSFISNIVFTTNCSIGECIEEPLASR